ncbi:MAG TPA: acyloxyacyl hydrolase [Steroidobacteraceae bacterium]|nr:acyloxyacyl hydrolase [Steroidobacteraceae bacterium]
MSLRQNIGKYGAMTALIVGAIASAVPARPALAGNPPTLAPAGAFVQAGYGDQHTDAYLVGVTWYLPWHFDFPVGTLAAAAEASIGRWHTTSSRGGSTAWPTQIGATPVLRLYPSLAPRWFAEIGVGPNYIVPLFHSGEKRFSTEFNFGDHFAVGRRFGASEVSMRIEHFSNAGIDHPNPGENFVQVRYSFRF